MAVLSTFLVIAELCKYAAEFPLPADERGQALLKFLVLGAIVSLVGYFIAFLGDWILIWRYVTGRLAMVIRLGR